MFLKLGELLKTSKAKVHQPTALRDSHFEIRTMKLYIYSFVLINGQCPTSWTSKTQIIDSQRFKHFIVNNIYKDVKNHCSNLVNLTINSS